MKNKNYIKVMQNILHLLDEGVHVVDKDGNSIIYNDAMSNLEKMDTKDVLNKPFAEIFKNLDAKDSTLLQALYNNKSTINKSQTYLNKDGKKIATINTTVPIVDNGEIIAAVEVAKDITEMQEMSNKILELRKEIEQPNEVKELKNPKNIFTLLQTADEVLDYKIAENILKNTNLIVEEGGNHSFENIDKYFQKIESFLG